MCCPDALLPTVGLQFIGPMARLQARCGVRPARHPKHKPADDAAAASSDAAPPPSTALPTGLSGRFFYDPPELVSFAWFPAQSPRHWAMHRDDPAQLPTLVVESDATRGHTFSPMCDGVFGAVCHLLRCRSAGGTPALVAASKALAAAATACGVDTTARAATVARPKAVIATTFNGLGIIVPFDKATELGFRPLAYNRQQLIKLLDGVLAGSSPSIRNYEELRTFAHIANDECDFGNGYLLGLELWAYHPRFTHAAVEHLSMAYTLLGRDALGPVLAECANHRDSLLGGPCLEADSAISGATTLKRKRK